MARKRTIFLTGATGLVGSYLMKTFLKNGHKVYALARSNAGQSARNRVIDKLKFWDKKAPLAKLNIIEGDIAETDLGINSKIRNQLKKEVNEIFHCAAITKINYSLEEIRKTNVIGTRNVLEFANNCLNCGGLKKINHISTAFICGKYRGIFRETDLDVGQEFNTTYEQSKFEAEVLIKNFRAKGLWIDIFRPSLIVGHSKTGQINQYRNIYQFIHFSKMGIFDSLPVSGCRLNVVPVDSVAESIYTIALNTSKENQNYHIFSGVRVPVENLFKICSKITGTKMPKIISREGFNLSKLSPAQRNILKNNIFSINFACSLVSRNTIGFLKKYGFVFPKLDEIFISRILKNFHCKDGKLREN